MLDFAAARRAMVDSQVRTNGVTDPALIAAMLAIPRERFVPDAMTALAYLDRDLPLNGKESGIGATRWLMNPMVLARLIQSAEPHAQDRALVVACGTGYAAAVLSRLVYSIVALEEDSNLVEKARQNLTALGATNVNVVAGALDGAPPGPFDIVLIDGGVEFVPPAFFEVLAPGGRLLAVVTAGPAGKGMYFQSVDGEVGGVALFDARIPVLPGFKKAPEFVF